MALGSFPVKLEHRVAWGEMDAFGHVNNANYLRWFESARIAYFEKVAVSIGASDASAWIPILGRATIDFRKPVSYPDTVTLEASVVKFGNTSFTMAYRAVSQKLGLAAEGEAIVVLLEPGTGAKTPIPAELRAAIEKLEG
ncbi:MAG TPA: thioesterase family protein [Archangium sp.]